MAERLSNRKEILEFCETADKSSEALRQKLALKQGIDMSYYEGVHWITGKSRRSDGSYGLGKLVEDYTPESRKLRVTANEITKFIVKVQATTRPDRIFVDVFPPERSNNTEDGLAADVSEAAINCAIEESCYLSSSRLCNDRRAITGAYCMGLSVEASGDDRKIRSFTFPAWQLVVDPHVDTDNLEEHAYVGYQTEWTADRIERVFPGVKLDRDNLKTLGEINQVKSDIYQLTNGRVYSSFKQHSKTKGARITQYHVKDDDGRFGRMYVVIDVPNEDKIVVNEDDPSSPFAGTGMPFIILTGHTRADTLWGISDTSQIRAYQDMLNLDQTLMRRITQKMAGFQWVVDRRAFGHSATNESIRAHFTNEVGGVIVLPGMSDKNTNIQPPQRIESPQPPPHLSESWDRQRELMRDNVHRAEGHFGEVKTHVTSGNFARALDEADQVLGQRVKSDLEKHERLIGVLHDTHLRHVQDGRDSALRTLRKAGFDRSDFAVLVQQDPDNRVLRIKLRESSIRYRSHQSRRQDIENAALNAYITPDEYMEAFARELDAPLTTTHRKMASEAMKAAMTILQGGQWEPAPVGRFGAFFLTAFREALFDRRAKENPEIRMALQEAISGQRRMQTQEALESDPQFAMQLMQPSSGDGSGQVSSESDTIDMAAIAAALDRTGGGAGTPALTA